MNSLKFIIYRSLIPLRQLLICPNDNYSNILGFIQNQVVSRDYECPCLNDSCKRFYPHYGATSNKRNTNLYKNGKTKRTNPIETKPIRIKKDLTFLANSKKK